MQQGLRCEERRRISGWRDRALYPYLELTVAEANRRDARQKTDDIAVDRDDGRGGGSILHNALSLVFRCSPNQDAGMRFEWWWNARLGSTERK